MALVGRKEELGPCSYILEFNRLPRSLRVLSSLKRRE